MPQADYEFQNDDFPPFRADMNTNLEAIATNNSGETEPTETFPYMSWADTTSGMMKQRNAADDGWLEIWDLVTGEVSPEATQAAAEALASQQAAAISEGNAAQSESDASDSKDAALASELAAGILASNASTSATSASTSASNAVTSEASAGNSASVAGISATNASTSASNAAISATGASTSETNAVIAASNAAIALANSTVAASNAATSETNAATSETNAAASAAQLIGTSTTSVTIGGGSKVFTTQSGKFFDAGSSLNITSDANFNNFMFGIVTSYSGTTLTMNITKIGGSGTFSDWTIRVSGVQGVQGVEGPLGNEQTFYVEDQKANNISAGTFTSGADRTRDLNTVLENTIPGASLSANQITLDAGNYYVNASAPALQVDSHQVLLYDVTGASVLRRGTSELARASDIGHTRSFVEGPFTLLVTSVLELRHRGANTVASTGFGFPVAFGGIEVYSKAKITKVVPVISLLFDDAPGKFDDMPGKFDDAPD